VKKISSIFLCFITFLLLSSNMAFAVLPPTVPTNTTCPKGYACCPDLSKTQSIDLTSWQLTGQPLPANIFGMAWWTSVGRVGYVTCYYNVYAGHPFTLESIAPVKKPALTDKIWKTSSMEGTLTCLNNNVGICAFQLDEAGQ
jgi:hypothetical protein